MRPVAQRGVCIYSKGKGAQLTRVALTADVIGRGSDVLGRREITS